MSVWEHFQLTEVLHKKCKLGASKLKNFLKSKTGDFVKECIGFVVFYGVLINLVLHLLLNFDLTVVNVFASGATYYILVDFIKLLAEHRFILFRNK